MSACERKNGFCRRCGYRACMAAPRVGQGANAYTAEGKETRDEPSTSLPQPGGWRPSRSTVEQVIRSAFSNLLAGEYNPAMQGYEQRKANRDKALAHATDAILSLPPVPTDGGKQGLSSSCSEIAVQGTTALDTERPSPAGESDLDPELWEVEVRLSGERVLTIGYSHVSGLSDIDRYGDAVRTCGEHLLAFIGNGEPTPCFACGDSGQERWMGANGEEVGPCSVCQPPGPDECPNSEGCPYCDEFGCPRADDLALFSEAPPLGSAERQRAEDGLDRDTPINSTKGGEKP